MSHRHLASPLPKRTATLYEPKDWASPHSRKREKPPVAEPDPDRERHKYVIEDEVAAEHRRQERLRTAPPQARIALAGHFALERRAGRRRVAASARASSHAGPDAPSPSSIGSRKTHSRLRPQAKHVPLTTTVFGKWRQRPEKLFVTPFAVQTSARLIRSAKLSELPTVYDPKQSLKSSSSSIDLMRITRSPLALHASSSMPNVHSDRLAVPRNITRARLARADGGHLEAASATQVFDDDFDSGGEDAFPVVTPPLETSPRLSLDIGFATPGMGFASPESKPHTTWVPMTRSPDTTVGPSSRPTSAGRFTPISRAGSPNPSQGGYVSPLSDHGGNDYDTSRAAPVLFSSPGSPPKKIVERASPPGPSGRKSARKGRKSSADGGSRKGTAAAAAGARADGDGAADDDSAKAALDEALRLGRGILAEGANPPSTQDAAALPEVKRKAKLGQTARKRNKAAAAAAAKKETAAAAAAAPRPGPQDEARRRDFSRASTVLKAVASSPTATFVNGLALLDALDADDRRERRPPAGAGR